MPDDTSQDRIVRRKLSDEVFDRLRQMILSGEITPGDPMPSERALMDRFGVGRPAVREALQTMHTMGLITVSHGQSSRVNPLNASLAMQQADAVAQLLLSAVPENLDHLKSARLLFEVGMVRQAAERRTDADIARLRGLHAAQKAQLGDPSAFVAADIALHRAIAGIAGNPIISAVSDAMLHWLFRYHTAHLIRSGQEDVTLTEHAQIIDAIDAGDGDAAARLMRVHLERSADQIRHAT